MNSVWQVRFHNPFEWSCYDVIFEGSKEECEVFLLSDNEEHGLTLYHPEISLNEVTQA